MDEKTIRLSVPIEREINTRFASVLPPGLKAQVVRSLVELFVNTQVELGDDVYLAQALIKGRVKLRVQNLNITDQNSKKY
jgi:hypothetical protein